MGWKTKGGIVSREDRWKGGKRAMRMSRIVVFGYDRTDGRINE
jgi:hypothetical protein